MTAAHARHLRQTVLAGCAGGSAVSGLPSRLFDDRAGGRCPARSERRAIGHHLATPWHERPQARQADHLRQPGWASRPGMVEAPARQPSRMDTAPATRPTPASGFHVKHGGGPAGATKGTLHGPRPGKAGQCFTWNATRTRWSLRSAGTVLASYRWMPCGLDRQVRRAGHDASASSSAATAHPPWSHPDDTQNTETPGVLVSSCQGSSRTDAPAHRRRLRDGAATQTSRVPTPARTLRADTKGATSHAAGAASHHNHVARPHPGGRQSWSQRVRASLISGRDSRPRISGRRVSGTTSPQPAGPRMPPRYGVARRRSRAVSGTSQPGSRGLCYVAQLLLLQSRGRFEARRRTCFT